MKHAKNKGFCGMFLRSAVAPDATVNLGVIMQYRNTHRISTTEDHLFAAAAVRPGY
ncbi:MAG TPA: hypothetical protein VGJ48_02610 [Pyrinomonadaceae bacterium]